MDFVPDESAIRTDQIVVDAETIDMLAAISMPDLPGVEKQADAPTYGVCEGNRRNCERIAVLVKLGFLVII